MLDEYQVDTISDEIKAKLDKLAGPEPDDRIVAYERMIELLRFYTKGEEQKARERE